MVILNEAWGAYIHTIVGAGSYVFNNLATISYGIFAIIWLLYSVHVHFQKFRNLKAMSEIVDTGQQSMFIQKVERLTTSFSKYSVIIGVLGAVFVNIMTVFRIDYQDGALNRMSFYATTPWTQQPGFAVIYPNTIVPYILGRFSLAAFYGFLAIIGGLVIWKTVLLLWLTSGEIKMTFKIYDADCVRPAEELLNSFWSMTAACLLLVPLATFMSINLREAGAAAAGRWMSYMSWTYILFFVGFFFFSLTRFYRFVSMSKRPVENQIRKNLELAIDHNYNPDKIEALKVKMELLQGHKSRPTITTIMQIAQMVLIITLNFIIRLLES